MSEHQNSPDYAATRSQSPSVNSQAYAIPISEDIASQLTDESSLEGSDNSEAEESSGDLFLDSMVQESSNGLFTDSQDPGPMLDVSKYIFESLVQAIESANFAEAISLQTKTSAVINSESTRLKQLIETTKEQLASFKDRFERGAETSKLIRQNLQYSKDKIDRLNAELGIAHPIEFNQAKEKVLERQFDCEPDGSTKS
ncbi:Kxd1p TDEL_0G01440 [Torulaspora delbrueckii]|uniref:Biogenesis of lysosome-related organelles complex 1 subunit KXD1 n=1 Tax=Torulaspora delbrueckii TaxID=4950 RepID=G8ZYN6_TORDE|nr:hypothetical protein TDEL_0G01440 [Torulaspora delbrueckii]CCE93511.1 hypothetical protein TDEL_0G01440 [Torulaspora delbrueckii]